MTNSDCGTAILFFSLSPKIQAQKKQWLGVSKSLARKTQTKLFYHTAGILKQSSLPYIHSDEHSQRGENFGSKLSNAIQDVFTLGYHSVIIVGNDCPQLNSGILENAVSELNKNQNILGPSQCGGVYLMGFHKDKFDKSTFENLPWQTPFLQNALADYLCSHSEQIVTLPFLADLNRYQDLAFFAGYKDISRDILSVFQALLQCLQSRFYQIRRPSVSLVIVNSISHRGPPCIR